MNWCLKITVLIIIPSLNLGINPKLKSRIHALYNGNQFMAMRKMYYEVYTLYKEKNKSNPCHNIADPADKNRSIKLELVTGHDKLMFTMDGENLFQIPAIVKCIPLGHNNLPPFYLLFTAEKPVKTAGKYVIRAVENDNELTFTTEEFMTIKTFKDTYSADNYEKVTKWYTELKGNPDLTRQMCNITIQKLCINKCFLESANIFEKIGGFMLELYEDHYVSVPAVLECRMKDIKSNMGKIKYYVVEKLPRKLYTVHSTDEIIDDKPVLRLGSR